MTNSFKIRRRCALFFIFSLLITLGLPVRPLPDVFAAALSEDELLDSIQEKSLHYFVTERNPRTGLVQDRAHNFEPNKTPSEASIAGSGFALAAYAVGVERGWLDRATAYEMSRRLLDFFAHRAAEEHGFFYHFLDMETGARHGRTELSPIDTTWLVAGALFSAEYFDEPEIRDLADTIYRRVYWPWMLHEGTAFSMAWSPEEGFDKRRWDHYDESLMMYLLAIGSPSHPIPPASWKEILRPAGSYRSHRVIAMPPLFTHQYSHIWIDFRNQNDGLADYFRNSTEATLANRQFCIDQAGKYTTYGPDRWGLTASDGPFGYRAYGAPPGWAVHDGTIAPTACGSSIVFTPRESLACLRHLYENFRDSLWGEYGFSDSFNLDKDWFSKDVLAIDQGALLLMIENYRSGLIWNAMKRNVPLQEAMKSAGFRPGTMELPWPDPPEYRVPYNPGGIQVDGYLKDWPAGTSILVDRSSRESGSFSEDNDAKAEFRFAWNENALYFFAVVTDDEVVARKGGKNLWQDDLVEIYIDPQNNGLFWYDESDFQIGFGPGAQADEVRTWSWFQGGVDPAGTGDVAARGYAHEKGYVIEGRISWDYLKIHPSGGSWLRLSPAVHDLDRDRSAGKLQWFFRNEETYGRFELGKLMLAAKTEKTGS